MATIECSASGCRNTSNGGKIFYQCNNCRRWWCSDHGHKGKKCEGCGRGFLYR